MLNVKREIGLMYSTTTKELGVLVADKLKEMTGLYLDDLCIGMGDSEEVVYNGKPVIVTTKVIFNDTHLTHIVLTAEEIPELKESVSIPVDEQMGLHYDNVIDTLIILDNM